MNPRCIRARAAQQMMHQRAEVLVQTPTTDEFGSTSYTETVAARWPCRVVHATTRPRDEVVADQNRAKGEWHVLMPVAAEVGKGDKLRVAAQTYLVIDTDKGAADAAYLLVYVKTEK